MTKALALFSLVAAELLAGCGAHLSTQEAHAECELEREQKVGLTDEQFAECVACYENCGQDCEPQGTTPEAYACPP